MRMLTRQPMVLRVEPLVRRQVPFWLSYLCSLFIWSIGNALKSVCGATIIASRSPMDMY